MDEAVHLLSRIQEIYSVLGAKCGSKAYLELPQIVLIGNQGCGKSSILESLIGRCFLPRGSGVVTRRPLVIQLINSSKKELAHVGNEVSYPNLEAWGCFAHKPDQRYVKFDEIKQEILLETCRVAGESKNISTEPIYLKIYSNSVNLTFIDPPGLVRLPVGDQLEDNERIVKELSLQYISSSNCIILAVVAANCDVATSGCLQLAHQVDPLGNRTVLVISKLDILDEMSDISDVLSGRKIVTPLCVVGVINRAPRDIKSIAQSIDDESSFFKKRYPNLAAKHGTRYLAKVLQCLLLDKIRAIVPQLRSSLISMTNLHQNVLNGCGDAILDKGQTILNVITSYCSAFTACIKGNSNDLVTSELRGGARISYIFQESFCRTLENINPLNGYNKVKILTAMRNASGTSPGVFIPEISFELLVKQQISQLEAPSLQCVELVYQELEKLIVDTAKKCAKDLCRFYNLHKKILDITSDIIRLRLPDTQNTIRQLIAIQMAYINTSHPDFVKDAMNISANVQSNNPCEVINESLNLNNDFLTETNEKPFSSDLQFVKGTQSDVSIQGFNGTTKVITNNQRNGLHVFDNREHIDCFVIEELIKCYFDVVRKNIQDYVPKTIMHCLVNHVTDNLQPQLVAQLYQPDQFDELLTESKCVIDKRKEMSDIIKLLEKANDVINEIRNYSNSSLPSPRL